MVTETIYFDNSSTTALDPRAFKAMLEDLSGPPANPSSVHSFGQKARGMLQQARQKTAHYFGVSPQEVYFTSGGTEAANLAIHSLPSKGHLITTAIEHSCVYKTVRALEEQGWTVDYLPCGLWGAPTASQIQKAIRPDTKAFIFSACNGETGVKIDLEAIAALAEEQKIPFLLDAVAFIGKEPFSLPSGVSALWISGHKFHAPKGIGALISRPSFPMKPALVGGSQEFQKRAGTENLAGILGLAEALSILEKEQPAITKTLLELRAHLEKQLLRAIPDTVIHGQGPRIASTINAAFPGVEGELLLMQLDLAGVAVSHGSACSSGALEPSRVLTQMGVDRKLARSSIRISLSRLNTREEIGAFVKILQNIIYKVKGL